LRTTFPYFLRTAPIIIENPAADSAELPSSLQTLLEYAPTTIPLTAQERLMPKAKTVNFETSLSELEKLVQSMESGELSLEDSLKAFESGMQLSRDCQQSLADAEQKVQLLMEKDGEIVSKTLDTEN
jgi:exodeoxyribonuclease VII small subunit